MQVTAYNTGQTFEFSDVVAQVLVRYAEGKTPDLAAKSAIQLGFTEDVILMLPGVTPEVLAKGHWLIDSGAFVPTATGTPADGYSGGYVDPASEQAQARLAAGLDIYGHTPFEVSFVGNSGYDPLHPTYIPYY